MPIPTPKAVTAVGRPALHSLLRPLVTAMICCFSLPLVAGSWQPYPADLPIFNFDGDKLEQQWDLLQRGTAQEYPSVPWVEAHLADEAMCAATSKALKAHPDFGDDLPASCAQFDRAAIADVLQQAWRDYFVGDYEGATSLGEALGPIGYPVGGYARIVYGQVLAVSSDEKTDVLKKAIELANDYEEIKPGLPYSPFVSAYSMGRMMEDMSMAGALKTGYNGVMKEKLEMLMSEYPGHAKATANYGGYNSGLIDKSGKFLARVTYDGTPENMEAGYVEAMKVEPPIISVHIGYAIALRQVYGDKERDKAIQILENLVGLTPLEAEDALELRHAKQVLAAYKEE
jgi:hypothetical protein